MRDGPNFDALALCTVIKSIDLEIELPDGLECLADEIIVTEESITEANQNDDDPATIRFLNSFPPISQRAYTAFGSYIFLFHDQTNDANIWRRTLQILSASGFCCVAPHLTNFVFDEEKIMHFLSNLSTRLEAQEIVLVASSMSGIYLIPFLSRGITHMTTNLRVKALIAIGVSDTHLLKVEELAENPLPCLVFRGTFDTSIGLNAANKLKYLRNSRLVEIPDGKHLCHLSHPAKFHKVLLNFLTNLFVLSQFKH